MIKKTHIFLSLIVAATGSKAYPSECFPPEVVAGAILEGRKMTLIVRDVHQCWVKALICTDREKCRADAYWVHASVVEAFKSNPDFVKEGS